MTMMIHTAVGAPTRPQIRIEFGFFAKMAEYLVQAHRHSREARNLLGAHDAMLKDVGLTRLKSNGNAYLFSHRN
jgi:hypothetical protein